VIVDHKLHLNFTYSHTDHPQGISGTNDNHTTHQSANEVNIIVETNQNAQNSWLWSISLHSLDL
jgi:hypothetical protein